MRVPRPVHGGRARTPTVIQMEAVECGAAALGMVLGYYRRFVPLEELRLECDVSRDGSKALNILKVARKYGLNADGWKKETSELATLPLPFIVFWNFNHFVVVEGFTRDAVYLNDPASGPRKVTRQEFDDAFTGVVLTFEPGSDFQPGGHKKSLLASLGRRLKGSESGLLYVVLASLMLVLPGLIIPAFIQLFVDEILTRAMHRWILVLLAAVLVTALAQAALTWLQSYYLLRLQTRLALTSSASFLWHVLRLPLEFYAQRFAGEIGTRVALNDKVASLLSGQLASALMGLPLVLVFALAMLFYDVQLTVVAIAMAAVNFTALSAVARLRTDANARLLQDEGKLIGTTMGGLQIIETIKANGSEGDFFARWSGYQTRVINTEQNLQLSSQVVSLLPGLVTGLGNVFVLCLGGLHVMQGKLSVGMLMAFQVLMAQFLAPINSLVNLISQGQEAVGDLGRLDDVLFNPALNFNEDADAGQMHKLSGRVELRKVTFGYSRLSEPLIQDFDLTIEPGQRIALVGATGSGKSTIGKLVCGLYHPWTGDILFDGRAREDLPRSVVTSSIAQVDQDVLLFGGTVRENLTLWDPLADEADVVRALKDAAIFETVMGRLEGLDSRVEEGGGNFSGGERQRLEIARALTGNPSFLVMDEATSALDPVVEKQIDRNLRARGLSCLIIAHRLSTIRDADQIIVLDNGKPVQRGTHAELIAQPGHYRDLLAADPEAVGT